MAEAAESQAENAPKHSFHYLVSSVDTPALLTNHRNSATDSLQ